MRKPKIGDIVHYYRHESEKPWAAIIADMTSDGGYTLFVMSDESLGFKYCHYNENPHAKRWSWPEEEKQCEHEYIAEHWATASYPKTGYEICKKCKQGRETPQVNKAENLIDKIFRLMNEYGNEEWATSVYNLIKEYKGIK